MYDINSPGKDPITKWNEFEDVVNGISVDSAGTNDKLMMALSTGTRHFSEDYEDEDDEEKEEKKQENCSISGSLEVFSVTKKG